MSNQMLYFDIESHSVGKEYDMPPEEFVRTFQYAWDDGPVHIITDLEQARELIRSARWVVGHNISSFDLPAIFGQDSLEPLNMAMDKRVIDTFVIASLVTPAPNKFTAPNGHTFYDAEKPGTALKWLGLENLCHNFGIPGKFGDLSEIAKRYNPEKTAKKNLDYGVIPVDDEEFVMYSEQDVIAVRGLWGHLRREIQEQDYDREYIWREIEVAAIMARMSKNGLKIDTEWAEERISDMKEIRDRNLKWLQENYDFPTEGKSPWASAKGKEVIFKVLEDYGITPSTRPDWTRTATGNLSLGGEVIVDLTKGTELEEFGESLAQLKGQRSLPQLAIDSTYSDGKAHMDITSLQRSGRWCLPETHKLLTKRGILHVDEVLEGDETLDMRNKWVKVKSIARFSDAEVRTYENKTTFLESTPEHRWVQVTENRASRSVEPLDFSKPRRNLQLTPDSYPFDPQEAYFWSGMTVRERNAAIIGLLVTDGTATKPKDRKSKRFGIYQSEVKFYEVLKDFLGDLVTVDYSRPSWKNPTALMHEFRLDTSKIQDILDQEGLDFQEGHLKDCPELMNWVLSLSMHETHAFLTAVYLADGTMTEGVTSTISTKNKNLIPVIQVAAYRNGRRSNYREYVSKTGLMSSRVALTLDRVSTRHLPKPKISYQDVWCVETETGTFTAWNPDGRWSGPYLTGNSFSKPGITIWGSKGDLAEDKKVFIAEKGNLLAGFDLSNADARAMASLSGDHEFARRFTETDEDGNELHDGHNLTGEAMFGADVYYGDGPRDAKARPKLREAAKVGGHGQNYNIGAYKLAVSLNDVSEKQELGLHFWANANTKFKQTPIPEYPDSINVHSMVDNFNATYPMLKRFKDKAADEGKQGFVTNAWNRRMKVDPDRSWTMAPALHGQSTTRELMADALRRLVRKGPYYARALRAVIHDELLMEFNEETIDKDVQVVKECMEVTFDPPGPVAIPIAFPVGYGVGPSWFDAGH